MTKASVGLHLHSRLCIPRDAQTCLIQHQQVVGAIADGNDLRQINSLLGGNLDQKISLALLANDDAFDLACELAVFDDGVVCMGIVNTQLPSEPSCQWLEAARKDCRLDTQSLQSFDQLWHTLGDVQDRSKILEECRRKTLEESDSFSERSLKLQLAHHRTMCDFGNPGSQVWGILDMISQKVNYFLSNESAVHVKDHQSGVAPPNTISLEDNVHIPFLLKAIDHLVLSQIIQAEIVRGWCG
ncbi:hypothetical protein HG531_005314 [Fusarium graminearum]|nr:hypothetical protein HG531_005314 [Fusarium graminearum]